MYSLSFYGVVQVTNCCVELPYAIPDILLGGDLIFLGREKVCAFEDCDYSSSQLDQEGTDECSQVTLSDRNYARYPEQRNNRGCRKNDQERVEKVCFQD